ncbi:MAG: S41 family peptidase [Haliscomenobacter sp.]|nr:S41 family peptidase [Haliscomenobacter sp.]MBP9077948.1 S41 family peptidase [Haliscomenobacter sp.]MBP9874438.1 S41 family peptidase [Haliscomenobacter sp.]
MNRFQILKRSASVRLLQGLAALALLASGRLLSGCDQIVLDENPGITPRENFEYLWKECDEKYAFFEYKGIDWDEVYRRYSPKVSDNINQDSLFKVLFAMLNELRDGHVNLIAPFNVSRYEISLLGPENIDERLVLENYLKSDYYDTGPFVHNFIADGQVGYIRYPSFSGSVGEFDLNFMLYRYRNTKGLILDLRQNGGGNANNVVKILNRFASQRTLIYQSYLKNGPGRDDFSAPSSAYAIPPSSKDLLRYSRRVAVLTDRGTFSAASFFALGSMALPNMIRIGDSTGGGLGIPNGGQLPVGWTYRLSVSRTLSPDGTNYENGVPPNIRVLLDPKDVEKGVDTVIERAVEELLR